MQLRMIIRIDFWRHDRRNSSAAESYKSVARMA